MNHNHIINMNFFDKFTTTELKELIGKLEGLIREKEKCNHDYDEVSYEVWIEKTCKKCKSREYKYTNVSEF